MAIKFVRIVPGTRKVEFDINGQITTRRLPRQFAGTTDGMIRALASGLGIEEAAKAAGRNVEAECTLAANEVLVPDATPLVP